MKNPFRWISATRKTRGGKIDQLPPVTPPRPRRSVRDALTDAFSNDAFDKASSPSTQMSLALGGKPVYGGTVAKATIAKRRAANKRARQARAMHRRAAR